MQKGKFQKLIASENLEQIKPQDNQESRDQWLSTFDWTDSTLDSKARQALEEILVVFHELFARYRFEIGINNDFQVQSTPIDDLPVHG